jgi:hypothetical protein
LKSLAELQAKIAAGPTLRSYYFPATFVSSQQSGKARALTQSGQVS